MITAIGKAEDGTPMIVCGLTAENLERMKAGWPVRVPAERLGPMGMPEPVTVVICYGEDQAERLESLEGHSPGSGRRKSS